jgi:hypothetical protein
MGDLHPRIVAATRTQLDARRAALAAGAARVGWKIALGIAEVEALAGSEPALGHITTATLVEPGGTFAGARAVRELPAETELAVEVGPEATVAGIAVAPEIVGVGRPPNGLEDIHRRQRLPPRRGVRRDPPGVGPLACARPRARLLIGGEVRDDAPATPHPAATVAAIGRLLEASASAWSPATASSPAPRATCPPRRATR